MSTNTNTVQHSALSWFEIPTADFDRARRFYETIFEAALREEPFGPGRIAAVIARNRHLPRRERAPRSDAGAGHGGRRESRDTEDRVAARNGIYRAHRRLGRESGRAARDLLTGCDAPTGCSRSSSCCEAVGTSRHAGLASGLEYITSAPYYFQAAGDPAVGIDRLGIGYFGSLAFDRTMSGSGILVARSTPADNGLFVDAVPTPVDIQGPSSNLFDDKDALTVDNVFASPFSGSVYSTFTQFTLHTSPIHASYSRDQAAKFSPPALVSHASTALCAGSGLCADDQGSSVAIGPHGIVYVAYENYDTTTVQNQILIARSTDGGMTFGAPVKVAADYDITNPYKSVRVNSFPNLAVNPSTGQLYVVWADQRSGSPELYISTSTSGINRWSAPRPVVVPNFGGFRFFPAVGVQASTGNVYVSFYDNVRHPGVDAYDYFYRRLAPNLKPEIPETQASRVVITPNVDFSGGFFGDYTSLATTSEGAHLIWTGTSTGQQDIETRLVR